MYVFREILLVLLAWLGQRPRLRGVVAVTAAVAGVSILGGLVRWLASDAPTRFAVSGRVLLAGEPLDVGTIEFRPIGSAGRAGGAAIRDGRYHIPRARGLMADRYEVRVCAARMPAPPTTSEPPGPGLPPGIERIPAEFGAESTQRVEVGRGLRNVFDFDIPARPEPPPGPAVGELTARQR